MSWITVTDSKGNKIDINTNFVYKHEDLKTDFSENTKAA